MDDFDKEIIKHVSMVIGSVLLIGWFIVWPCAYLKSKAFVQKFKQTEETVRVVREKGEMPEADVMITMNQVLAEAKYWNEMFLIDWLYTDEIEDLEPIE